MTYNVTIYDALVAIVVSIILLTLLIIISGDNFVKMKVVIFGHKLEHQYPPGYLCQCGYCKSWFGKFFKKKQVFNTKLHPDFTEDEELIGRDLILIRYREIYEIHYPDRVVNTITITSVSYPEVYLIVNDGTYGGKILIDEKFVNDIRRPRRRKDIIDNLLN